MGVHPHSEQHRTQSHGQHRPEPLVFSLASKTVHNQTSLAASAAAPASASGAYGDAIIVFPKANVVHMGDDFVTYGYPVIDFSNGGSIRGMIAAADRAIAELPADVKVIPGHGDVSTIEDVKKFSAMLKDCVRLVEVEVKLKKTLAQAKADKPLARYDKLATQWVTSDGFVDLIYKELTEKKATPAKVAPPKAGR